MKRQCHSLRLIGLTVFALLSATSSQAEEICSLSLGVVPQFEQRKLLEIWQPIINELESAVNCQIDLAGSENIPDFEARFAAGQFDIAYMNPYHALVANRQQGYLPVLRSAIGLQGVLVVNKDSGITDIQALNNHIVAFPSPNALGASLLMRAELQILHQVMVVPKYVKTHPSVYLHVAKGLVSAGGGIQRSLDEQPDAIKDKLRVIYTTQMLPSHPLVIHPRVTPALAAAIVDQLLEIAARKPERFEAIPMSRPLRTSLAEYQAVAELHLEQFQN
jgi:phosphonate transport system substrate-binding protein